MAVDLAPTAPFSGYSSDGATITIPLASITGLTANEASSVFGDWRDIMLSLCMTITEHYEALDSADKPSTFEAYDPTKVLLTWSFPDVYRQTYSYVFLVPFTLGEPDVVAEPEDAA